jgi:TrmH family RNA methyltransferase
VTSVNSDRVTVVRALSTRSGRRKSGRFLVEGPQAVRSALAAGVSVHELFVDEDAGGAMSDVVEVAKGAGCRISLVTRPVMVALCQTEHPQGVLAVCSQLAPCELSAVLAAPGPVLLLESVSDPGNVGTIIRTADAIGAAGVLLTPESADVHNGKVVRSTAGSLFHLPVVSGQPLTDVLAAASAAGRTVAALTGDGELDLFEAASSGRVDDRTLWIVGSEAHGVSDQARAGADLRLAIPMTGRAESLNAAIAAATALYVTAFASAQSRQNADGHADPA